MLYSDQVLNILIILILIPPRHLVLQNSSQWHLQNHYFKFIFFLNNTTNKISRLAVMHLQQILSVLGNGFMLQYYSGTSKHLLRLETTETFHFSYWRKCKFFNVLCCWRKTAFIWVRNQSCGLQVSQQLPGRTCGWEQPSLVEIYLDKGRDTASSPPVEPKWPKSYQLNI